MDMQYIPSVIVDCDLNILNYSGEYLNEEMLNKKSIIHKAKYHDNNLITFIEKFRNKLITGKRGLKLK